MKQVTQDAGTDAGTDAGLDADIPDGGGGIPDGGMSKAACPNPSSVGYRVLALSDRRKVAAWYPSSATETAFSYPGATPGSVALGGIAADCVTPLIVFSHGLSGCATQSLFITESLARAGYVVVGPDHADAVCSVDGTGGQGQPVEEPFTSPELWSDTIEADRKADVLEVLALVDADVSLHTLTNGQLTGALGHSLGGYTVVAMSGGWASWNTPRIAATLGVSPYVEPLIDQNTLPGLHPPVMYQGARFDIGITPSLERAGGAYDISPAPKYFAKLASGSHFLWTNATCTGLTPKACLSSVSEAGLIFDYGLAFFDRHLRQNSPALLDGAGTGLMDYRFSVP